MRFLTLFILKLFLLTSWQISLQAENIPNNLIKAMQSGGHILMIRHANAPGFGDPDNIKIGDCSTQRNLDDRGRKQSINIGKWLKKHNIKPSSIYSSQWCRCLETAELLDLGPVKELPSLNSFFQMPQNRQPSLRALRQFISEQSPDKGLIIMSTHFVTISEIAGQSVQSGEGVLLKLNKTKPYEFVGTVSTDRLQ